jgi:hypothetical protein
MMSNQIVPDLPTSLESKVELFISGRKLKDLDAFSKSDPICHVYMYSEKNKRWEL